MGNSDIRTDKNPHRLKELVKLGKISPAEFFEVTGRSEQTFNGYMKGDNIPIDVALKLADKYSISLDWFYKRNTFFTEVDIMVSILSVLDKVFKFKTFHRKVPQKNGTPYEHFEKALFIDERFYNFIVDIQDLETLKSQSHIFSQKDYQTKRAELYEKHKEYLYGIFKLDAFNEEKAIEIESAEDISIIDLFANLTPQGQMRKP